MAFDMFSKNYDAAIGTHEEEIFYLINEDDNFPQLNRIWENYYKSPKISVEQANELVHELIEAREKFVKQKSVTFLIDRLLPFFSKAYRNNEIITCVSD